MFRLIIGLILIQVVLNVTSAGTGEQTLSLTDSDKSRLRRTVELKPTLSDNNISNIYYYVNVRLLLDKTIISADANKICQHITTIPDDKIETIFYITYISKKLNNNCKIDNAKLSSKIQSLINADSSVLDLYRAGITLSNLGKPIDSAKYSKLLLDALKKEESLLNTGLAFILASKFKPQDQTIFIDKIPDVIVQADEVDGRFLQFEGGLGVSSAIVRGIYNLAESSGKPIKVTKDQAIKFVNYFLSRKHVLTPKGASEVLQTLALFTKNKNHIPLVVTKYGSAALSQENPIITVKVTNVLGESIGPATVTGTSLTLDSDKTSVLKNIAFKPVEGDSTLFAYDFFQKPLSSGFYTLNLNVVPQKSDPRILGNTDVNIKLSILTQIKVENAELTITDIDVGAKNFKLVYPSSLDQLPDMDYTQRFLLKFQLKDHQNDKLFDVHQAFVRFYHLESKQEIIFISEIDSTGFHKVDLNLQPRSKDFMDLSGQYQINLFIGDPLIQKAIDWKIATVNIQFSGQGISPQGSAYGQRLEYSSKPEIQHLFREQDKRPHALVSNFFTILVLLPLLALFIAWFKIGINMSNFSLTISSILFHGSLAAIFLLYSCFFLTLNMFQTVKYLAAFSAIAYLSGHSLLSYLIRKKL